MVWKRVMNLAPYLEGKSEGEQQAFLQGLRLGKETFGAAVDTPEEVTDGS